MLQGILTGQTKGSVLLSVALMLFLYLLPAVLAFARAHRRFLILLLLNLLVSPAQAVVAYFLNPSLLAFDPHNLASVGLTVLMISFGPGWLTLLLWALAPGEPADPWPQVRDALDEARGALPDREFDAVVAATRRVIAAMPEGEKLWHSAALGTQAAILLGSEAHGISPAWREAAAAGKILWETVRLPMRGRADSLNVSATAAVLAYESLRQADSSPPPPSG